MNALIYAARVGEAIQTHNQRAITQVNGLIYAAPVGGAHLKTPYD